MFSSDMELDEADAPFDAAGAPFAKLQRLLGPHAHHSEPDEAAAANSSQALPQALDAMAAALQEERLEQRRDERPRQAKSATALFGPTVYGGRGVYAILQQQGQQLAAESAHACTLNEGEEAPNDARSSAMPAVAASIRMVGGGGEALYCLYKGVLEPLSVNREVSRDSLTHSFILFLILPIPLLPTCFLNQVSPYLSYLSINC